MSEISQVQGGSSIQNLSSPSKTTATKNNKDIVIEFPKSEQKQQKEPKKWFRPGSYDINQFSKSTGYIGDVKCTVYTDKSGNKYGVGSVGDLVLLNKVKSGNLFHKARYEKAMSESEYEHLTDVSEYEDTRSNYREELQKYGFKNHPAKDNIGTIKVNGETMMVIASPRGISVIRETSADSVNIESTDYHSLDELKSALDNKDNNWGQYPGIRDINDYFIP